MITRRKPIARSWIRRTPKRVRRFVKPMQLAREAAERKADRDATKARERCRAQTYNRAHGRCEHCGRALILKPSAARTVFELANIHEEPPRSLGGDPLDSNITVCLCCACHKCVTDHELLIAWRDPALQARGGAVFSAA